jgi:molybdopterin-binding protein
MFRFNPYIPKSTLIKGRNSFKGKVWEIYKEDWLSGVMTTEIIAGRENGVAEKCVVKLKLLK